MVQLPQRHLRADLLAHRHKCNANDSERLECVVLGWLLRRGVLVVLLLLDFPFDDLVDDHGEVSDCRFRVMLVQPAERAVEAEL